MNTTELFEQLYKSGPEVLSRAPGRLEVLGNHTDYNEGFVLSVAVDSHTEIAFKKTAGLECRIVSPAFDDRIRSFSLDQLNHPLPGNDWTNYLRGVVFEMQQRNFAVGAFDALINSNMPLSAGMSSSASLEMALVCGLCELFDLEIPLIDKAGIGQGCENNYIGARTGLMDQLSSLAGRKNHLIVSEYRGLTLQHCPLPQELALVVINSGVKHDLSREYNERRQSCERARDYLKTLYPQVNSLRDVSSAMLRDSKGLSATAYKRASHVIQENERVLSAQSLLSENKLPEFGQLLFDSHQSSIVNFENSCDELNFLVEVAKQSPLCLGARLSGGGFGGITIHLVRTEDVENYLQYIKSAFENKYLISPDSYVCQSSDGAGAKNIK